MRLQLKIIIKNGGAVICVRPPLVARFSNLHSHRECSFSSLVILPLPKNRKPINVTITLSILPGSFKPASAILEGTSLGGHSLWR